MADTDACEDIHHTTPLVPENPYDTGGGGGDGGGGSCDCDPTSGSYPTTTTLSTEIGGNTGVALSSVSGLASSKVVIGETLIYDGAGTVGRVIAKSGNNLTVQTMTTAGGGGGGGTGESSGSYLTSTALTTAFTGTTNVPKSSVTGLNPADMVVYETLIFDDSGTVGRVIGTSGDNYIVQTMTIAPGERSGARLGAVNTQAALPATCAAATALGWQTPISGDYAYVRDYNGHLAEFLATVDDDCNITWAWSHDLNAGDYITGVREQDGTLLTIAPDGTVTLPRESDGTYKSTQKLNTAIDGTRVIPISSTNITSLSLIVLNETLVYDTDGTVGKVTAISGNNLTIRTITTAGSGDESDGSYPTSSVLSLDVGVSTDIAISSVSGLTLDDVVINETLIYDERGTLGRVVAVNTVTNELTVETMTTSGDPNLKSDGTYHTTQTITRTIGASNTIPVGDTSITDDTKIAVGETLLYDDAGTMAVVTNFSSPNLTAVTITTAGSSDGTYKITSGTLNTTIDASNTVALSNTSIPSASKIVKGETLLYDAKGTMGVVTNVSGNNLTVKTISAAGLSDGSYPAETTILNTEIGGTTTVAASDVTGITVADVVNGETLVYDRFGTIGRVTAVAGTNLTVQTMTVKGDPAVVGVAGKWFEAYRTDGATVANISGRFWMLEDNALNQTRGNLQAKEVTFPDPWTSSSTTAVVVELPGPGVYYVSATMTPNISRIDNIYNLFEYDPVLGVSTPLREACTINHDHTGSNKTQTGPIYSYVEVPAGQVKYVGYVNTKTGSDMVLNDCSLAVHSIGQAIEQLVAGEDVYSTEEQLIGNYLGKPLYKKTIIQGWSGLDGNLVTGLDIDTMVDYELVVEDSTNGGTQYKVEGMGNQGRNPQVTQVTNGLRVNYTPSTHNFWFSGLGNYDWSALQKVRLTVKYTKNTDAAGSAPNKNSLLLSRPDLWTPNTEIDFGGGLYGCRYQGTITKTFNIPARVNLRPAGSTPIHLVNWGGEYELDSSTHETFACGSTRTTLNYQNGIDNMSPNGGEVNFCSTSGAARTNSPYDVWLLYTK